MKLLAVFLLSVGALCAQRSGAAVQQVRYPYDQPTTLFAYDGSGNLTYVGYATSKQASFSWTRTASTLTSIAVASNVGTVTTSTAHGLAVGNSVIVAGSTTSALNGTYRIATIGSTTTFTITTSGVSDATYNNAAMTASTTAPRSSAAIWSISCLVYNGSNQLISKGWAGGLPASSVYIWDNRATISCQ